ncbi:amidase [Leifsonia shinshuensis]|uniref:Amidase n=1 Tax=Leifsonia shinshuensis TaxID=150026 RepID=A0A7G6YA35_9MICO|nr:amidase [Leifsonia shinshuensis]QNE35350.1 amidase [Leifsonia shinshuensis]
MVNGVATTLPELTPGIESGVLRRLIDDVRFGRVTSRELVERCVTRIDQSHHLGAVVADRRTDAIKEAEQIDSARLIGEPLPLLAGIPLLAKDNTDVRGLPTSHGSRWHADAKLAIKDGDVIHILRDAGAIPIGKTNVPEFCIEGFTDNLLFGPTLNPWNPDYSPGGSSGGSAAALAAGIAPIATGTDGGGSVRIPAAFCGLLGFKPTNGLIVNQETPDWIDFSTDGVMATSADDLRLITNLLTSPNTRPLLWSMTPKRIIIAERTDDLGPLPPEIRDTFHQSADRLTQLLGVPAHHLEPGALSPGWSPDQDWFVIASAEHSQAIGAARITWQADTLHPNTRDFLSRGIEISIDDYIAARWRRYQLITRLEGLLGNTGLLVTPTVAVPGFTPDGRNADGEGGLLGADVYSTALQNMTGLPAISLPAGRLPNGMPYGLQVTAPRWADTALIKLAEAWERQFPWPRVADGWSAFDA